MGEGGGKVKQVWLLTDKEVDRLVEIMHRHTELAKKAALNPHLRENALKEIKELRKERIELIGR